MVNEGRLNRRKFLRTLSLTAISPPLTSKSLTSSTTTYSMLHDNTKCIGCGSCVVACKLWNGKYGGRFPFLLKKKKSPLDPPREPKLDEYNFLAMVPYREGSVAIFQRRSCMHCVEAPCLYVCPTGAIYNYKGINLTDFSRCFGCKYCVVACPYRARSMYKGKGWGVPVKCWFCLDRLERNLYPACVSVCPVGALDFSSRDEIINKALSRKEELEAKGLNAYVWGIEEMYGTNVVLISSAPFEKLGVPEPTMRVATPEAYPKLMVERGGLAIFGSAAAIFLGFVLWRRSRILKAKIKEVPRGVPT